MQIRRFAEILQDEGLAGISARLLFPKPRGSGWAPPPVTHQVAIIGGRPDLRDRLARILRQTGRRIVSQDATPQDLIPGDALPRDAGQPVTRFHIDPDLGTATSHGPRDVLILARKAGQPLARISLHGRGAQAVIELCPDRYQKLRAMGLEADRLFLAAGGLDRFEKGIYRFLLAAQAMDPDQVDWRCLVPDFASSAGMPRLCLSLGEAQARRRFFKAEGPLGFVICDGLRLNLGWIGAALGYRAMAQACLARGVRQAIFCEDDVEIPADFEIRLAKVLDYLRDQEWDVFSGLSTHIRQGYHAAKVERHRGETFLHLNRTTGMVFNILNHRALERLAGWRHDDQGLRGITIDAHLESMPGLRAVTTLPFLVDHCDALSSTAWGFSNRRYRNMISTSQDRLARMAAVCDAGPSGFPAAVPPAARDGSPPGRFAGIF